MPQHTPGPWKTAQVNSKNWMVHHLSNDGDNYSNHVCDVRAEANARLIAAAPDMFQALLNLKFGINQNISKNALLECIDTAIAKAKGG